MNLLDSRFRGNDKNGEVATFYETINHYMILHKSVRVRQLVGAKIFPGTCRKSCRKPVVKINASFPQGGKADCVFHLRSRAILPRPSLSGLSEAFGG